MASILYINIPQSYVNDRYPIITFSTMDTDYILDTGNLLNAVAGPYCCSQKQGGQNNRSRQK